jgi:hypothetical protein
MESKENNILFASARNHIYSDFFSDLPSVVLMELHQGSLLSKYVIGIWPCVGEGTSTFQLAPRCPVSATSHGRGG